MTHSNAGWGSGLLGVLIFSGSLPATRLAVADISPIFLTSVRALIAALLGALCLLMLRQARPASRDFASLAVVALGVVVGFPLLTGLALQHITAARSIVFIGLLPLATATFAVVRGGERPNAAFWGFSLLGAATVAGFALAHSEGGSLKGDVLMVAAVLVCGLGYAEGAAISRRLGGWQVISWALLLALPVMAVIAWATLPPRWGDIGPAAWAGLAYVSVFSMFVGFVFWYRGLALGGIARVGQVQLLQAFFSIGFAALLNGEAIGWDTLGFALAVVACVAAGRRLKVRR
ncbi:MAG: DMT family transporter [Thermomicrobiales bacterium]|nr:DMT family transporter [Thermomicrobiales bacterium]